MLTKLVHKVVRLMMHVFCVFPIRGNRIMLISQKGRMFACNPRVIFEYLYDRYQKEIEFVWVLNQPSEDFNSFDNVIRISYNSFLHFYYQMTSRVIVSNIPSPIYLPLRNGQIMIDTWHGGGAYKKVGLSSPSKPSLARRATGVWPKTMEGINNHEWEAYKAIYNQKDTTFFISSSQRFTGVMLGSQLLPLSAYLEIGMPRNDIFFSNCSVLIEKAKRRLGISLKKKIVLYAPTYRGNAKDQKSILNIDIELCIESLGKQWGGEWVFVYRGHVWGLHQEVRNDNIINASQYEEMQELLCMADVFITDYSSSMWDFALTKKPAFLFTPDLEYYLNKDRGFYTPIDEWPFPYAQTNDELVAIIESFDTKVHLSKVNSHLERMGSFEQGNATEVISKLIATYL